MEYEHECVCKVSLPCAAALRIKKALGIFRELIPTRTTEVAFWDPPSGFKNLLWQLLVTHADLVAVLSGAFSSSVRMCVCMCACACILTQDIIITKRGMWVVRGKSWSSILFEINRLNVRVIVLIAHFQTIPQDLSIQSIILST